MKNQPGVSPTEEEDRERHDDDPGEVPTAFATKGAGWSGRDQPTEDDDDDE